MNKLLQFIKESRAELRKVNWPTREQTIRFTSVVVGVSLGVALFLGALDFLFEYILKTFIIK
jgi:preprotein translocase subunit SecE